MGWRDSLWQKADGRRMHLGKKSRRNPANDVGIAALADYQDGGSSISAGRMEYRSFLHLFFKGREGWMLTALSGLVSRFYVLLLLSLQPSLHLPGSFR